MDVWTSPYLLTLAAVALLWAGVSAYVLVTRALYDFRHLSANGARRVVQSWLAQAPTPEGREEILRRLPRRTLAGIASDSRVDDDVARAAARILLDDRWQSFLRRASRHGNEAEKWARVAALRVFALAGWAITWPLLAQALEDSDADVVAAAVAVLGSRPEPEATQMLLDGLVANRFSRSRIATQLEGRELTAELLPLLDHADEEVRYWAVTLLTPAVAQPRVELALAALAGDGSPQVRAAVAKAFAVAGGRAAAAVAVDLLRDDVWFVRAQAARALGRSDLGDAAPRLVPLLRDEAWWVRAAAKEALAELGPAVVPTLLGALRDRDRFARNGAAEVAFQVGAVRRWAEEAAREDGDGPLSRLLSEALAAGDEPVQRALVASIDGAARRKVEQLIARLPESRTA